MLPAQAPSALLYWLPAMGVAARHYLPLAQALAARGIAVALHEWRGIGSSNRRAGRHGDWGYRELLQFDLPAGLAVARERCPGLPAAIGGHSLGGQLASLYTGLHPQDFEALVLVASGSPYWRRFRRGALIGAAYALAPVLAGLVGHLPGRRLGFGGNEARGVVADWARSGRSGRYAAAGLPDDLESAMARVRLPILALRLRDDWLGPQASLDWLLAKMPQSRPARAVLDPDELGVPADHFAWMKQPAAVAAAVADGLAPVLQRDRAQAAS
ncbi:alpha/beta fold hydrolase [Dyella sp. LX-66]|uniref:alpha/beta hydrolase family protein n=1 Tax=unclassified Dyella TaxID=2634549 RepID=UPI001BDFB062|nr:MULTISPECIES: alpha/beta fold hydrolase [unclassified Dyella]MBT2117903.1 alpha/beta fold hydrolase [Dyella sp. LX-1]MBT2140810.1 alpha/beta fold hydrolase [Dyella sp. LX-66]